MIRWGSITFIKTCMRRTVASTRGGREGNPESRAGVALALFCFLNVKGWTKIGEMWRHEPWVGATQMSLFLVTVIFRAYNKNSHISAIIDPPHLLPVFRRKSHSCVLGWLFLLMMKLWRKESRAQGRARPRVACCAVFSPSHVPWGLCGLRLLTTLTIKATRLAQPMRYWKCWPDHLIFRNEILLRECQLEFWLVLGPLLSISWSRLSG